MKDAYLPEDDDPEDDKSPVQSGGNIVGALVEGALNAGFIFLIGIVPSLALTFVGPGFAAISWALIANHVAAIVAAFIKTGYKSHYTKHLSGLIKDSGGALSSFYLWTAYPFVFSALGVPFVDHFLPIAFGIVALFCGLGALKHFIKLIRGPGAKSKKKNREGPSRLRGDYREDEGSKD